MSGRARICVCVYVFMTMIDNNLIRLVRIKKDTIQRLLWICRGGAR